MDIKQQIQSLRDTALQLSLTSEGVWHAESGIRGGVVVANPIFGEDNAGAAGGNGGAQQATERRYFRRPLVERAYREFMKRFLCVGSQQTHIAKEPWRTFGFAFAAAGSGCSLPNEVQEKELDGVGHSFVYGDGPSLDRLARLIASPAMRYLSRVSAHGWVRDNSWDDPQASLGDWVYMIYEIGLKTGDPNLRRFYRFLVPFDGSVAGVDSDLLMGFDGHCIHKDEIRQQRVRQMIWGAASRKEIAFARLGTELTIASRIALDYLLDMKKLKRVGDEFYGKRIEQSRFEWAIQAELMRATNQVIGAGALDKGTLSNAVTRDGKIESNGKSGRACRVKVKSFLIWIARKEELEHDEVVQIRNAVIGEISSRKK